MCGHQHGLTVLADATQKFHHFEGRIGVEVARRLVGEDDIGVVEQGAGDGDALLLAARHLVWHRFALAAQSHFGQHLVDAA